MIAQWRSVSMPDQPYIPHPVDTSKVTLAGVDPLFEDLARNAHEIWAQKRMQDGWVYGPQRDDAMRTHPCLVPYDQLPESEKEYDRVMVNETLKTILALGYHIVKG
jgi:RyR domain